MMRRILYTLLALLSFTNSFAQEKFLDLLREEIEYQMNTLSNEELPPYYINYRVVDYSYRRIYSSFGASRMDNEDSKLVFLPQVRIGSPEFDNFNIEQNGNFKSPFPGSLIVLLASDRENDQDIIRRQIREEVNKRYLAAVNNYRTALTTRQAKTPSDTSPDFTPVSVQKHYEKPQTNVHTNKEMELWKGKLNRLTALFNNNRDIINGGAYLTSKTLRRYFVSSEGTEVVENNNYLNLIIEATTVADDGMELPLLLTYFAFTFDELPTEEELEKDILEMSRKLSLLRVAPIVDPYSGPALLSGSASGVFFHEIFGHRVEAQKMKSDSDGQTFKSMVGQKVLPDEFSVSCDPTMKYYHGHPLDGHYIFDDQGVKGERVEIVKDGVLTNFLMTRTAITGFDRSNGHARADLVNDPTSRQSNLIIETNNWKSEEELRKMLIAQVLSQGKEFGFYFKTVTGGLTQTGRNTANSFNVNPVEVYKVYADGREDEIVRGANLIGTPLSMFSNIINAGGDFEIFSGQCGASSGYVPVTAISPVILVSKIELQRKQSQSTTVPVLDVPVITGSKVSSTVDDKAIVTDSVLFGAMKDEMKRTMSELSSRQSPGISLLRYYLLDRKSYKTKASGGKLFFSNQSPGRNLALHLYVGDTLFSSNHNFDYSTLTSSTQIALEDNYNSIRRDLWLSTDLAYKIAMDLYRSKKDGLTTANLSMEEKELNDMIPVKQPVFSSFESKGGFATLDDISAFTIELSSILDQGNMIFDSSIDLDAIDQVTYMVTSEGSQVKEPLGYISVLVQGKVRLDGDKVFHNSETIVVPFRDDATVKAYLTKRVKQFTESLISVKRSRQMDEDYIGPVLFEESAVSNLFAVSLVNYGGILSFRKPVPAKTSLMPIGMVSSSNVKTSADRVGKKLIDNNLSVVNWSSLKNFKGIPLVGSYNIDAEGISPADGIELVREGILKRHLSGSVPTLKSSESTGSVRFGFLSTSASVGLSPGILEFKAKHTMTDARLRKELLKLAKNEGLDYAYVVKRISKESQVLIRLNVADGSEEVISGAEIQEIGLSNLRRIAGISKETSANNHTYRFSFPISVIHPNGIILEDIQINRKQLVSLKETSLVKD